MDPVTGSLIAGGAGGLLGLVGTGMTNSANKEIAGMNIALQRETNAKNEALMRESWQRDDTAVQRRTEDLTKAGMSPLLAAGSAAGNSGVVSMHAPESKQVVQRSGLEGAISGIYQGIMQQQSYMDMMARQQQILINQGSLAIAAKQVGLNREEQYNRNALTGSNLTSQQLQQEFAKVGLKYEDQIKVLNLLQSMQQYDTQEHNYSKSREIGLRTTDSPGAIGSAIMAVANSLSGYPESPMNRRRQDLLNDPAAEKARKYWQGMAFDPTKGGK